MSRTFDRLAELSVDRRGWLIVLIVGMTGFAVVGYLDPEWILAHFEPPRPVPEARESERGGQRPALPDVDPFRLSGADAVIVVDSDDFFTPEGARAMRQVVDELEALDQVRRITWMDRVPILNIFGLPEPLFPRSDASPTRFEEARQKALAHPLIGGQLLSDDAQTLLLLVSLDELFLFEDADATTRLRETAERTAAKFPQVDLQFQVTGRIPAAIAAIRLHESNQVKFQLIGYGMVILMTLVLFRGIRAVLTVIIATGTGVFWTLGLIRYLQYGDNPLVDVIVPILVSLVGLTDGVHLMVEIRKLRAAGLSERDAARTAVRQIGLACFLTSLTTAIGLGSLVLADSDLVREFGVSSVIGVTVTFVAVVTIIPLLCSTALGRRIHVGHEKSLVERNLRRITYVIDASLWRPQLVSFLGIALTVLLLAVSLTLQPDQRLSDGLPERAEATRAMHHVDEAFGGLEFAEVQIRWSNAVPSDDAEILTAVAKVDDLLNSEELIGHPLSIRNLIDAQPGSGPPAERMSLLELLPPPLKRAFYTPEHREARVTFRVQDLGIARYAPVFERIEAGLARIGQEHPRLHFLLQGNAVWRWRNLYQIVVDLSSSLGTAAVIIFCVLGFVYRSVRIGLISIVPNIFPLAFTGAYLALVGYNLEIVMVCSFTVCLGIAVDDTIHFLTRFQEERRIRPRQSPGDEVPYPAIRRAFTSVGTALIMTTVVLVVGFSTVIFSESRDHKIFATMGALTIGAALFADLVILPALLATFVPLKPSTGGRETSAAELETELGGS